MSSTPWEEAGLVHRKAQIHDGVCPLLSQPADGYQRETGQKEGLLASRRSWSWPSPRVAQRSGHRSLTADQIAVPAEQRLRPGQQGRPSTNAFLRPILEFATNVSLGTGRRSVLGRGHRETARLGSDRPA